MCQEHPYVGNISLAFPSQFAMFHRKVAFESLTTASPSSSGKEKVAELNRK